MRSRKKTPLTTGIVTALALLIGIVIVPLGLLAMTLRSGPRRVPVLLLPGVRRYRPAMVNRIANRVAIRWFVRSCCLPALFQRLVHRASLYACRIVLPWRQALQHGLLVELARNTPIIQQIQYDNFLLNFYLVIVMRHVSCAKSKTIADRK